MKGSKSNTWSANKFNILKRRPLNRYDAESSSEGMSAKNIESLKNEYDVDVSEEFGYIYL